MSTTNAVSNNNPVDMSTLLGPTTKAKASANQDAQDKFLKLLVTQMKNQDPLNPMDNAQVTSQIAQLNTVQGITQLNTTMSTLATSFASTQAMQATNLIGHSVLAPGDTMSLSGGQAVFGVELPQSVDTLKVVIQDGAGNALHAMDIGPHDQGTVMLGWDGITDAGQKAADGQYKFVINTTSGGSKVTATALSLGLVQGITPDTSGVMLNLGGTQSTALSDVRQIM